MPTMEARDKHRRRRSGESVVVNITFDREAIEILNRYCPPGRKGTGRLLGRLLYEHAARQEERQRLQQRLVSVMEEEKDSV